MSDTNDNNNGGTKKSEAGASPAVLLVIAIGLLAVYVVILWLLFRGADDKDVSETIWGRYTYLLGGLEAIVFTAVGWLFGREVNRKQAEQAEQAQEEAKQATARAEIIRERGEELRQTIMDTRPVTESVDDSGLAALHAKAQRTTF